MVYMRDLFGVGQGIWLVLLGLHPGLFEFLVLLILLIGGPTVLKGPERVGFRLGYGEFEVFRLQGMGAGLAVGLLKVYTIYLLFGTTTVLEGREDDGLMLGART